MERQAAGGQSWPEAFLLALSRVAVLATALIGPLYFNPRSARVFEPDKWNWLLVLALVLLWATLARFLLDGLPAAVALGRAARQPLLLLGLCSLLSFGLSWAMGSWPALGLWGSYRRGQGLLADAGLWLIFFAAAALARRPGARRQLWRLLLVPAPAAATYALLQRAGIDSLSWNTYGSSSAERAFGSLGNPNFLAAYLAFLAPLAMALGMWAWPARREGRGHLLLGAGLSLLACLAGLAATASRGAVLGAAAGLALCLVLPWALARPRKGALALPLAALLLGLATLALGWRGLDGLQLGRGRTVEQRLLVWQASARLMAQADAPAWLWGPGPESLPLVLGPHLSERLVQLSADQYFDRAHNRFWDALATRGLLGLGVEALLPLLGLALCLGRVAGQRAGRLLAFGLGGAMLAGIPPLLTGNASLTLVLAVPGALAGMLGAWGWGLRAGHPPGAPAAVFPRPRAEAMDGSGPNADTWLSIGTVGLMTAHLVEGAFGLATVAAELVAVLALAAVAGQRWAEDEEAAEPGGPTTGPSAAAIPPAWRTAAAGSAEGLALAAVLLAPILLPDPKLSLDRPGLLLIPVACLLSLYLLGGDPAAEAASQRDVTPRRRGGVRPAAGAEAWWWRPAAWGLAPCLTVAGLGLGGGRLGAESFAWGTGLLGALVGGACFGAGPLPVPRPRLGWRALVLLPILALGLGALAWRWAGRPLLADRHLRAGQEEAAQLDLAEAADALAAARRLWPDQPMVLFVQAGVASLRMEAPGASAAEVEAQFALAREALAQARSLAPLESLLTPLADLYRGRGDLALGGSSPSAEEARHWWSEALDDDRATLERYPLSPPAWLGLARTQERLGQLAEARQAYDQAWNLNAGSAEAAAGALRMALAAADWEAALRLLDRALGPEGVDAAAFVAAVQDERGLATDAPGLDPAAILALAATGARPEAVERWAALRDRAPSDPLLARLEAWLGEP